MKLKPIRILKQYQEELYKKESVQLLLFYDHEPYGLLNCSAISESTFSNPAFLNMLFSMNIITAQ